MNAIDRIKEWMDGYIQQREKEYGSAFHKDEKSIEEFYNFLSSLEKERCVWKASDSPYYYWELSCHGGGSNDQANTSWEYCPYCGKRIEIKEEGNG